MKKCPKCKKYNEFSKNKNRPDGLQGWCKSCRKLHRCKSVENKRQKERYNCDDQFRIRSIIGVIIQRFVVGTQKTSKYLPYSSEEFRNNIESKFTEGMSWNNHNKWHIHHRVRVVNYNLNDEKQRNKCNNLSNLFPIWIVDHIDIHRKRS